jgi:hypothetical protein
MLQAGNNAAWQAELRIFSLSFFHWHLIFLQNFDAAEAELQLPLEHREVDGFGDNAVASSLKNGLLFGGHGLGGHRDDGDFAKQGLLAHPRRQC